MSMVFPRTSTENPFGGSSAVPRQGRGARYPLWSQSRPRALREEARHNSSKAEQKIRFLTSCSRYCRRPSLVCFSPPLSSTFSPSLSAYLLRISPASVSCHFPSPASSPKRHHHRPIRGVYTGESLKYHVCAGCHTFSAIQTLAPKFIGTGLHLVVLAPLKCHAEPRFAPRLTRLVKLRRTLRLFVLQFSDYTQEAVRRRSSCSCRIDEIPHGSGLRTPQRSRY